MLQILSKIVAFIYRMWNSAEDISLSVLSYLFVWKVLLTIVYEQTVQNLKKRSKDMYNLQKLISKKL